MKSTITKADRKFFNRKKAHTTSGKKYVNNPKDKYDRHNPRRRQGNQNI